MTNFLYKLFDDKLRPTNLLYTPTLNDDGSVLCMQFINNPEYQMHNYRNIPEELLSFFYHRELDNLKRFQGENWTPILYDEDPAQRKIYIEFNCETLNQVLFVKGRNINDEVFGWKEQIYVILNDMYSKGYLKTALYPHCFFVGTDGLLKTIDFYSCFHKSESSVPIDLYKSMIGEMSVTRFEECTINNRLDLQLFWKYTLTKQLDNSWPDNPFPEFYERLKNETR